jgi:ADP-ribose pyrophosphatase YjhB (NUDIX family)
VGAIIFDAQGRLLMIQRGHDPGAGLWSIPGGRIEPGETDEQAVVRELLEETNLHVMVGKLVGSVRREGPGGTIIDIRDFTATVIGGTLRSGDDAADARWVAAADLDRLEVTEGLIEALTEWGVLGDLRLVFPFLMILLTIRSRRPRSVSGQPSATGRKWWVTQRTGGCRAVNVK